MLLYASTVQWGGSSAGGKRKISTFRRMEIENIQNTGKSAIAEAMLNALYVNTCFRCLAVRVKATVVYPRFPWRVVHSYVLVTEVE